MAGRSGPGSPTNTASTSASRSPPAPARDRSVAGSSPTTLTRWRAAASPTRISGTGVPVARASRRASIPRRNALEAAHRHRREVELAASEPLERQHEAGPEVVELLDAGAGARLEAHAAGVALH